MAVSSSVNNNVGVFPSRVRSSSKVDLSAKILPMMSSSPAISPSLAISLKLGSQRIATLPRPVQAQNVCASDSELLVFYPHKFVQVLTLLQTLPDVRTRCRQIERYGQQLPLLTTPFLAAVNRVEGFPASYNTYVHAILDHIDPSLVYFYTHSDAAHVRGLAIILVAGLSGSPVRTIADMSLAPFTLLMGQSLLPASWSRQFMLLLEHMQRKARELVTNTGSSNTHAVEDVLSIMGLESSHILLKDEIHKTRVVHELFSAINLGADDDGDDVHVDN